MYMAPAPLSVYVKFTDTRTDDELAKEFDYWKEVLDRPLPLVAPCAQLSYLIGNLHGILISMHRRAMDWSRYTAQIGGSNLEDIYLVNGIWYRFKNPDKIMRRDYYIYAHLHRLHPQRDEQILDRLQFNTMRFGRE